MTLEDFMQKYAIKHTTDSEGITIRMEYAAWVKPSNYHEYAQLQDPHKFISENIAFLISSFFDKSEQMKQDFDSIAH